MKQKLLIAAGVAIAFIAEAAGAVVEFDKIKHWAGSGDKCAALVIQFNDGKKDCAYVWGYRWDGSASGEDMMRTVCGASKSLAALVQYTGSMGSTLNGVGLSKDREFLSYLNYDFERAAVGGEVNFNYFEPNTGMGQTDAPGDRTPEMVKAAIELAKTKGIIEHPLNARRYGYPAYDYDYWQLAEDKREEPGMHWQSGWYEGYWSYWVGTEGEELSYSGLGMSSSQLGDRSVNLWNYSPDMADFGSAPEPSANLDYEMAEFGEEMHAVEPHVYPVEFDKIQQWIGSGEKFAAFVVKYNDGQQPDNLVIGYRWSGGWDDRVGEAVKIVNGSDILTSRADRAQGGEWSAYGIYPDEPETFLLNDRLFVSPRSVVVYTFTREGAEPDWQTEPLSYDYEAVSGTVQHEYEQEADFVLFDMNGRQIAAFRSGAGEAAAKARAAVTAPGIYIIKGTSNNTTLTKKLIVK